MKNTYLTLAFFITLALFSCSKKSDSTTPPPPPPDKVDAFPGAEGFGRYATGGRGGQIIYVDKLTDVATDPGTLRYAIQRSGPRIIIFKVSGTIKLNGPLELLNGDVTIAGQTAPGDGITLRDYPMIVNADNVIIRFMRFRLGDFRSEIGDAGDCITGRYRKNILLDHCSISWSIDENVSFYANQDFTMQWCIISESLRNSKHPKGRHGYGGIWGGTRATFHHNLLAHNDSRNARFDGGYRSGTGVSPFGIDKVDYRNNVIYNWAGNSAYGGENGQYNMVNNYYKAGPATPSTRRNRIMEISMETENVAKYSPGYGKFYIAGNFIDGNTTVSSDNWNGGVDRGSGLSTANFSLAKLTTPITAEAITSHTAEKAYNAVRLYGGASLKRDAVDIRIIKNVTNKDFDFPGSNGSTNGLIDSQDDVGGWPVLESLPAAVDTDFDGMPDDWEITKGLNPNLSSDRNDKTLETKYTNVEVYLNSLVQSITTEQLK